MHHPVVMVLQNRHYVSNDNGELIMCLLALFDKQDANYKSNDLKNNVPTSITDQLGQLGSCCSIF